MTAEILAMNAAGVALAADSAVTVPHPGGRKVFLSANKIFSLSKFHPVAAMVYGDTVFHEVPWETILKTFRAKVGKESMPRLSDYADALRRFLVERCELFAAAQEQRHLVRLAGSLYTKLKSNMSERIADEESKRRAGRKRPVTDYIRRQLADTVIAEARQEIEAAPEFGEGSQRRRRAVLKYRPQLDKLATRIFDKPALFKKSIKKLGDMFATICSKQYFPFSLPGIVVAGFGSEEPFPSYEAFEVESVVAGLLKWRKTGATAIGKDASAVIAPFAQRDMAESFMQGIHPTFYSLILQQVGDLLAGIPIAVTRQLVALTPSQRQAIKTGLQAWTRKLTKDFQAALDEHMKEHHHGPVMGMLQFQPKEQLATIAEMLVTMTMFRRQVTAEPETVAGPVDVALISKGDGLVWIRRKHYFEPGLNPQFFATYSQR